MNPNILVEELGTSLQREKFYENGKEPLGQPTAEWPCAYSPFITVSRSGPTSSIHQEVPLNALTYGAVRKKVATMITMEKRGN